MEKSGSNRMLKTIDSYFDDIDIARSRRARELSEIKMVFGAGHEAASSFDVQSKALVVLSYAVWEGFYNECVETYCDFLESQGKVVSEVGWGMLVGVLNGEFDSLRDRHHSSKARREFVEEFGTRRGSKFEDFDRQVIRARSNLNWERLSQNFSILDFDLRPFQKHRIRLEKEVVGWRHSVAHGDAPNLAQIDAAEHVSLVREIMLLVADTFQTAMLKYI